jgi:hypothetical protein
MSVITIGPDGNVELSQRTSDKPVDYIVALRVSLNAEQRAEFEGTDEVILRHPTKPSLIRARVRGLEVIE